MDFLNDNLLLKIESEHSERVLSSQDFVISQDTMVAKEYHVKLQVKNLAKSSDSGRYFIKLKSSNEQSPNHLEFTVLKENPFAFSLPEAIDVLEGETINLKLKTNQKIKSFHWEKDTHVIKRNSIQRSDDLSFSLTIPDSKLDDSGIYSFICDNFQEKPVKCFTECSVNVKKRPEKQIKSLYDLGNIKVKEGELIELKVKFDRCVDPNDIKVFLNDNEISNEKNYIYLDYNPTTNSFTIKVENSKKERDEGIYKIKSPNSESECTVIVEEKPIKFISALDDVKLKILPDIFYRLINNIDKTDELLSFYNRDADFEVELSKGSSDVSWLIDNLPIEESANFLIKSSPDFKKHFLTIKNCNIKQSGQTIQFKLNKYNIIKQANLSIEEVPIDYLIKVRKPLIDLKVKEKECCQFLCGVQINSMLGKIDIPLHINWFKNNEELLNSAKYVIGEESDKNLITQKLEIKNCSLEDSSNFCCRISLKIDNKLIPLTDSEANLFVKELDAELLKPLPPSLEVFSGENIMLICEISKPNLQVEWFKDNIKIPNVNSDTLIKQISENSYSYELTVKNSQKKNSGKYKLVYKNLQSECKVIVKEPQLEILVPLEEVINVDENQTGILKTTFSNRVDDDSIRIELYKNSRRIYFSNKSPKYQMIVDKNEVQFFIKDFCKDDEAKYEMKLSSLNNDNNITQQTQCVLISNDLDIIKQLDNIELCESQTAKFFVITSKPCECEWYYTKNKQDLKYLNDEPVKAIKNLEKIKSTDRIIKTNESNNSYNLTIEKTKLSDSGIYIFLVKCNNKFSVSNLTVNASNLTESDSDKPVIIQDLFPEVEGFINEPFSLKIKVKGDKLQYEWFNGKKKVIPLIDQVQIIKNGETSELIFNFNHPFPIDSGDYYCRISNPFGNVNSRCCNVTITDPSVESDEALNSIFQTKPRFIEYFSDVYVEEHTEAQFKCKIIGKPEPKVTWFCNCRKIITDNEKFECVKDEDYYILIVKNIGQNDEGEYSCKASNCKGETSWAANLYLNDSFGRKHIDYDANLIAPNFLRKIKDSTVLERNIAKLDCYIDGEPFPTIKWYKNNSLIEIEKQFEKYKLSVDEDSGNVCLLIYDCIKKDEDEYAIVIENSAGKSQCSAYLSVEISNDNSLKNKRKVRFSLPKDSDVFIIPSNDIEIPEPPDNLQIDDYNTTSLTLKWDASPSELESIITYIVEYRSSKSYGWSVYSSNIDKLNCQVNNLAPGIMYSFRARAENFCGVSNPTQAVSTKNLDESLGSKLDSQPVEKFTRFNLGNKPSIQASGKDVRFYIEGETAEISIPVFGKPAPTVKWIRKEIELTNDSTYKMYKDRFSNNILEIKDASEKDEGAYEIIAENEHGLARHEFYLQQADPPVFLEPFKDVTVKNYEDICITCKVDGIPYPEIKFYKDWRLLTESYRIRIKHTEPDTWTITIKGSIVRDSGLYTCTAKNIAGATLCSCNVNVVDSVLNVPHPDLKTGLVVFKRKKFDEDYEIVEQINKSLNSTIYRVIERCSAKEFIAKVINKPEFGEWIKSESDCLNQIHQVNDSGFVRLHDAYEIPNSKLSVLVFDECKGKNLIESALKQNLNEKKIALYIKELLELLDTLHSRNIVHLDLNLDNILVDAETKKLKLIGFTHSKCLKPDMSSNDTNEIVHHEYGDPEFVASEIVSHSPITLNTDMWSVGVLSYILLGGKSPFYVQDDVKQSLENVGNCNWNFGDEFNLISHEAKDFVQNLLVKNPKERMNVKQAMNHPWIHFASQKFEEPQSQPIDKQNMIELHSRYLWSKQSKLREPWKKQMPVWKILDQCDSNGSAELEKPNDFKEAEIVYGLTNLRETSHGFDQDIVESEFYDPQDEHLNPGSYLLPVRDPLFTVRLREYQRNRFEKVKKIENYLFEKKNSQLNASQNLTDYKLSNKVKTIKERYHVDVYGKCIKRGSLSRSLVRKSNSRSSVSPRSASHRSESLSSIGDYMDSKYDRRQINGEGSAPIIREKLKDMYLLVGSMIIFRCKIEGNPIPKCFWYLNDRLIIGDDDRYKFSQSEDGVSTLSINKARVNDIGVYRCAAHNQYGTAITNAKLTVGDIPDRPSRPIVSQYSSDQVFLIWEAPSFNGNSDILCYKVDFKISDDVKWSNALYTIQESCLVKNLQPLTKYRFRVSCINTIGISAYSWASEETKTLAPGESKITIDNEQLQVLLKNQYNLEKKSQQTVLVKKLDEDLNLDKIYKIPEDEEFKLQSNHNPIDLYEYENIIIHNHKMKFFRAVDKANGNKKLIKITNDLNINEVKILREFKEQDRLIKLLEGFEYCQNGVNQVALVYTHATPVLDFITYRHKYSEELVIKVLRQLLDAIEWVHLHGFLHLNIHPLTILNSNMTQVNIKLAGFDNLVKSTGINNEQISFDDISIPIEFSSPEILNKEILTMSTDIWSIGVFAALLLSGSSPFLQENDNETTKSNISFCRLTFDEFYENVTGEAVLFIQQCLRRSPNNRLTLQECMEHKLFNLSVGNTKKRENILFLSDKLKSFNHNLKSRLNYN